MNKRKRYSAEFKGQVALETLNGEKTTSELASRFKVHPSKGTEWQKQSLEGMQGVFKRKTEKDKADHEAQIKELHTKIGRGNLKRSVKKQEAV